MTERDVPMREILKLTFHHLDPIDLIVIYRADYRKAQITVPQMNSSVIP